MLKEKVNDYLNRKELSKKAIEEIVSILAKNDFSSKEIVEELVEILFALKADVVYRFVCKQLNKIPEDLLGLFVELCQKAINTSKFNHAFLLAVAFNKREKISGFYAIVSYLIQNYVLVSKVNKQIYFSFERALHYDGADCFFEKWAGVDERTRNGFRRLLVEFLGCYPKPEYAERVTKWFHTNGMAIHSSEQEIIARAMQQTIKPKDTDTKATESNQVQEKKETTVDLAQIPIIHLLEAVQSQAVLLLKKADNLEEANKKLQESEASLTAKMQSTALSLKAANLEITTLGDKVKTQEYIIERLNRELFSASKKMEELNKTIEDLTGKLFNLESAYVHAGQQEIDFIKGQIKKRLAAEHTKYVELKDREPDLDYYVILLDMLEEIFYVLNKNGIKFD